MREISKNLIHWRLLFHVVLVLQFVVESACNAIPAFSFESQLMPHHRRAAGVQLCTVVATEPRVFNLLLVIMLNVDVELIEVVDFKRAEGTRDGLSFRIYLDNVLGMKRILVTIKFDGVWKVPCTFFTTEPVAAELIVVNAISVRGANVFRPVQFWTERTTVHFFYIHHARLLREEIQVIR